MHEIEQPFHIVEQELTAEIGFARETFGVDESQLPNDLQQRPVALFRGELVSTETGHDGTTVGVFLPVDGEGIEVLSVEIHHRVETVHPSAAQPQLSVL